MTEDKRKKREQTPKKLPHPVIPAHLTWFCIECGFVLGYTDDVKTELRIKFKDQYVQVTGAEEVGSMCRRCGKWNILRALSE
jgi:hypothetical protein